MDGLIIKKEWLDLIFDGGKTWEMRSHATQKRGPIWLIESGTGLVVGACTLTGCVHGLCDITMAVHQNMHHVAEDNPFYKSHRCAWVLEGAARLVKPIPYTHPQGAVIWVKDPLSITKVLEGEG